MVKLLPDFPRVRKFGLVLEKRVQAIQEEESKDGGRQDLQLMCQSYMGRLTQHKKHQVPESDFHYKPPVAKPQGAASEESKLAKEEPSPPPGHDDGLPTIATSKKKQEVDADRPVKRTKMEESVAKAKRHHEVNKEGPAESSLSKKKSHEQERERERDAVKRKREDEKEAATSAGPAADVSAATAAADAKERDAKRRKDSKEGKDKRPVKVITGRLSKDDQPKSAERKSSPDRRDGASRKLDGKIRAESERQDKPSKIMRGEEGDRKYAGKGGRPREAGRGDRDSQA